MNKVNPFFAAFIWAIIIITIDFFPANPPSFHSNSGFIISLDKLVHFAQHLIFAIFLFWGFLGTHYSLFKKIIFSLLISFSIGLFIEIIQKYFIPNRSFNKFDLLANIIGSLSLLMFILPLLYIFKHQMQKFLIRNFYKLIIWMLFILILCLLPANDMEKIHFQWLPQHTDKLVHAGFYTFLSIIALASFIRYNNQSKTNAVFNTHISNLFNSLLKATVLTLNICIGYGLFIELAQHFYTTSRHFELSDVLFNSMGAVVGCCVFWVKKEWIIRYF